jgi:hypothetical protein
MTRPKEGAADGADSVAWGQSLADCDFSRAITTESNLVCSLIARYVLYCNVTRRALVQIAGAGKGTVLNFVCGLGTMGREELSHGPTQGSQDPGCYS